jgi:hypothetical protein
VPVTTDVQRVRLLISDSGTTQEFTDDEVQAFLDLEDGAIRLAAADALETLAGRLQSVESDDIKIDGSKRAGVLMAQATKLREQHAATAGGSFTVVPGPRF